MLSLFCQTETSIVLNFASYILVNVVRTEIPLISILFSFLVLIFVLVLV